MTAIYPQDLPDDQVEQLAAEGNPIFQQLAKQRGLVIKTASIDDILHELQFEWLEE